MKPGEQLRDYVLEAMIGEGGMAEVWRARHVFLDKVMAIKIMARNLTGDPRFEERFLQEARAMARLQHPHIVGATDFFIEQGASCLVMPYLNGGSVADLLDSRAPLDLTSALTISSQILSALDHAHRQGIIHRDVKPSNILLDTDGRAFLADFGIALMLGENRKTRTGTSIGTPQYMSPEQIMHPKTMDHRADVYSYGCVLYEMVTGHTPFEVDDDDGGDSDFIIKQGHLGTAPTPPGFWNPSLPQAMDDCILKALEKHPDQRYQGCGAFAAALGGDFAISTPPSPHLEPPTSTWRPAPPTPPAPAGRIAPPGHAPTGPQKSRSRKGLVIGIGLCFAFLAGFGLLAARAKLLPIGPQEVVIGGVAPVTGEAAAFGLSAKHGYEMAVAEWNSKGGIDGRPIRLVFADDKGDPAEGATVYTRLIEQDKVVAILGPVMSKVALAGAPICQNAGIPMMGATCTNPKVTAVGDYIYRACFIDPLQGTIGARFAFENLGARRAACIFDVGNDYTKGLAEFFKARFIGLGGQVIGYEGHATGATDFKAELARMLLAAPDVLYVSDYYNDAAIIAQQARELGFRGPLVGGDGWDSPKLVQIGGSAVEGCYFTNHFAADDNRPAAREFASKYRSKFGAEPDALGALGYDAACLMFDAIRRAGKPDGPSIKAALARTDMATVTGRVRFDLARNPLKPACILEIKDGRQVFNAAIDP